jgi:hypothetical protein
LADSIRQAPAPPCDHRRGFVGPRLVAVTGLIGRCRHENLDNGLGQVFAVAQPGEAAIGQMLARPPAVASAKASLIGAVLPLSEPLLSSAAPASCRPVGSRHRPSS